MSTRPAQPLVITAPAKVNLYLAVGDRRPDGYHDVTTVLAALELSDRVEIRPADTLSVTCDTRLDIPEQDNLAYRAAVRLAESCGRDPAIAISLHKRIPDGAGLGGGSSDAAAVLAGLCHLWDIPFDDSRVISVARSLGADVAFFLGGGVALFDDRGDRLVESLPAPHLDIVVARPPHRVPTARAYAEFDLAPHSKSPDVDRLLEALRARDPVAIGASLHNNLTEASARLVESVAEALAWIDCVPGVLGSALAGSGSAVFAICGSPRHASDVAEQARLRGLWSAATSTRSDGVRIEEQEDVRER